VTRRKLYRIEYRDPDPGCPIFTTFVYGHDQDDAIERFLDDGDEWLVLSCKEAT
jgi:hypothetical protein